MKTDRQDHPEAVTITQAVNGYLVRTNWGPNEYSAPESARVFPTLASLFEHLASHFTHRCTSVAMDPTAPVVLLGNEKAGRDVGYASGLGFTEFGRRE